MLARCAADYARSKLAPSTEMQAKLDGSLNARLQQWLGEMGFAECSEDDSRKTEIQDQRITVLVTHRGDLSTLTAAGLTAGFDSGGATSGHVELGRILELAALPEVTFLEAQPAPEPDVE